MSLVIDEEILNVGQSSPVVPWMWVPLNAVGARKS